MTSHPAALDPTALDRQVGDVTSVVADLHDAGISVCRGAFARPWVEQLRTDVEAAFEEARSREGGAVGRGPNRWYVEVHPQAISGFVDLVSHPWVTAVSEAVLGPDWSVVEIGFDVPFPGAVDQPWHRDFPSPVETHRDRRLTSLAFNLTCVDTTDEMGPFEIAPGTQWEAGDDFEHAMFPPRDRYPDLESIARRAYPRMGDVSVRSALTLHRGTRNRSQLSRPVVVLGVVAPTADEAVVHQPAVTHDYWKSLPEHIRRHLDVKVVDELTPITQLHTIEGLVMGEA